MWDTFAVVAVLLLAGGFVLYRYAVKRGCGCNGCGSCSENRNCSNAQADRQ